MMRFFLALLLSTSVKAATLRDIIVERTDLDDFRKALVALGLLDSLLDSSNVNMTVFVPNNEAVQASPSTLLYLNGMNLNPPRFVRNLNATIENHIHMGDAWSIEQVFNRTTVTTLFSQVTVDATFRLVGSAAVLEEDLQASNGVLHIINRVMEPAFYKEPLSNLELQPEFGPDVLERTSLVDVVDFVDARYEYEVTYDTGLTHAGCRIRAFNRINDYHKWTINHYETANIIESEFLNESMKNETITNFIQYSLIPKNYFIEELPVGFEEYTFPINRCAHMIVTKQDQNTICFNNGCSIMTPDLRTYMASNGVGYVIDKCLVCPGIAMLIEYIAQFTKTNMKDEYQFFTASEWNRRNLSMHVGDGGPVTLFAAPGTGWFKVDQDDHTRLSTDEWKPHLWDFLKHSLVQGNWTEADLRAKFQKEGKYNLTSLANQSLPVEIDADTDTLMVNGADMFKSDIMGVDGMLHFITDVPLPLSYTDSVYQVARRLGYYEQQTNLLQTVFLDEDLNRLLPVTALYAPDSEWQGLQIALDDIEEAVLENHIFEKLWWCENLVNIAGNEVTSLNGQNWLISVNEDGFPCFDVYTADGKEQQRSCITKCDILARNGIVHEVDRPILFKDIATRQPSPPVPPTMRPPTNPVIPNDRPSSQSESRPPTPVEPTEPVDWTRPKRQYDLDELDAESGGSSAALIPCTLLSVILPLLLPFV